MRSGGLICVSERGGFWGYGGGATPQCGSVGRWWWCIRYRRCGWRGGMEQLREGGVEQVGYGMGSERFWKSKLQGKFV